MPWAVGNYKGRAAVVPAAHSTAARYRKGCRCDGCRRAYAAVQADRRARVKQNACDWTVSAELARQHLLNLRAKHVGKRAVSDCTGISDVVLMEIANGKRRRIRESTEEKIMRVTEEGRSGGSLVRGKNTTKLLDELIEAGFTRKALAARLGYEYPEIQFYGNKYVTATNAMRVEKLHTLLLSEGRVEHMMRLAEHRTTPQTKTCLREPRRRAA